MFRRLFVLLATTGSTLFFAHCAATDKEKPTPTSQLAVRVERAEPLLLDSAALSEATASVAENAVVIAPKSDADNRVVVRATDALLASAPADVQALLLRGKAKSRLKNYDAAIADYNAALRFAPTNAEAYYYRGLNRLKLRQYPAAIADFNKATLYNPQYKEAYFGRGAARMQLFNFKAAIPDFTTAIGFDANYADAYEYRGISYASLNQPEEAKADLQKAAQLNPAAERSLRRYVEK